MLEAPGPLLTLIAFIAVLGPLVFVHEYGHYIVARWCGVKAETFSIGFGHELAGWTDRRGTRWKIGLLPLGGYVQFAGDMNPASAPDAEWRTLPPAERARAFPSKPVWQRAAIVFAGPAVNFLLALVLLSGLLVAHGEPFAPPVVDAILPGSAAAEAGLRSGDRMVAIDGNAVESFRDVQDQVFYRPGEPLALRVARGGRETDLRLTPRLRVERDRFGNEYRIGLLGVKGVEPEQRQVRWHQAPARAVAQTGEIITLTLKTLGQVITGRRSVNELGGPLRIAKISGEQVTLGISAFIGFVALMSINLGFINLLPIPMLDGGHLMFYAIEAIRRRPPSPRAQEWAFRGGFAFVAGLMLLVTFNDLGSFGLWDGLARLVG